MNESEVPSTLQQYGPVGLAVVVFAGVIVYLFRLLMSRSTRDEERIEKMAEERAAWTVERERIRGEFEEKARELAESYAEAIKAERDENRTHEDLVRKEFAELMERLAEDNTRASDAMVQMLQKFHDRFVGPTSRRR